MNGKTSSKYLFWSECILTPREPRWCNLSFTFGERLWGIALGIVESTQGAVDTFKNMKSRHCPAERLSWNKNRCNKPGHNIAMKSWEMDWEQALLLSVISQCVIYNCQRSSELGRDLNDRTERNWLQHLLVWTAQGWNVTSEYTHLLREDKDLLCLHLPFLIMLIQHYYSWR